MTKSKNIYPVALMMTDTHLHKNNIELVKDIFQQAIDLCKELDIKLIFHLGDFVHSREAQPELVINEMSEIFKLINDNEIDLIGIDGNHDRTHLESESSYLSGIDKHGACIFHKEVVRHVFDNENFGFAFLPYFKENGSYLERLEKLSKSIDKKRINILLTHISINGVTNNDGSGVENEIKQDLFKQYDSVFVGHYHQQQSQGNIYYIGGSFAQNFGEDNLKGFTILYSDGSHKFVKSRFPEYIKIKADVDDYNLLAEILEIVETSYNNVRLILTGEKEKLQAFDKTPFTKIGIEVKFESTSIIKSEKSSEIVIYDRSNIKEAFGDFCKLGKIKDNKLGNKYLEQILNQILCK